MKSANCPMMDSWFFLSFALSFIELRLSLISFNTGITVKYDEMPSIAKLPPKQAIQTVIKYSRMTAIKYPIGLFESNGNLKRTYLEFCLMYETLNN